MADLRKFMWDGAKSGMALDLYLNRWPQIGNGKAGTVESLHVAVSGLGSVMGIKFNIAIEILMPDLSHSGKCTVIMNGARAEGCAYSVSGGTLTINHPQTQIQLQDSDKKWTWVHINNPIPVWIGAWPSGMNTAPEDHFGDVKQS